VPDLYGHYVQVEKDAGRFIEGWEIHERQVGTVAFKATNAFVIVEEVAAAVKDELVVMLVSRLMRRTSGD